MMTPFEKMMLLPIPADYGWDDVGIVRMGTNSDVAALALGNFTGETAVSERYWFERLNAVGVSVICPDCRGYGLAEGEFSEAGCYDAAHAARVSSATAPIFALARDGRLSGLQLGG